MRERIMPGDFVIHFKHESMDDPSEAIYYVAAVAKHSETGEKLMVYQNVRNPDLICARPYDMFMSDVDKEKYHYISQRHRMERIIDGQSCTFDHAMRLMPQHTACWEEGEFSIHRCNSCGYPSESCTLYCPNCGARMANGRLINCYGI